MAIVDQLQEMELMFCAESCEEPTGPHGTHQMHFASEHLAAHEATCDLARKIIEDACEWFEQHRPQWGPGTLPTWYADATR